MAFDYQTYFRSKYGEDVPMDYVIVLEGKAKECLISLLYKGRVFVNQKDKERAYEAKEYWILRCMEEMHEREGCNGITGYKENGLSITFDSTQLSDGLRNEIVPIVRFL